LLTLTSVRDQTYGLPFAVAIKSIYYNLELVARAGGDPNRLPTSWDEVISLQKKIQALGEGITGLYFDYYYDDNNFSFHTLIQSQGGSMATPDNRVAFDGREGMQALQWLRQIGEAGMIDMTIPQAYQSFGSGKMGILVASSSRIAQVTDSAKGRFEVRVTGFPRAQNGRVPGGGAAAMIHAKDPDRQKAAWEFVKFATGPVGAVEVVLRSGYIPGNTLAADNPELLGQFYATNPNHRVMLDQIPVLTKFYNWPGENSLKIPTVIRDHLQQVVTLKATPEEIMPKMSKDVQALLRN
jgi:multiple sugar transport system substrate-binding protein